MTTSTFVTTSWEVTGVKTQTINSLTNTIVQVYWKKIGTDENGIFGVFNGATPFTSTTPMGDFIPFSELTEEQVLSWIKVEAAKYEDHIDEQIQKQIDNKNNEATEPDLPWAISTLTESISNPPII